MNPMMLVRAKNIWHVALSLAQSPSLYIESFSPVYLLIKISFASLIPSRKTLISFLCLKSYRAKHCSPDLGSNKFQCESERNLQRLGMSEISRDSFENMKSRKSLSSHLQPMLRLVESPVERMDDFRPCKKINNCYLVKGGYFGSSISGRSFLRMNE